MTIEPQELLKKYGVGDVDFTDGFYSRPHYMSSKPLWLLMFCECLHKRPMGTKTPLDNSILRSILRCHDSSAQTSS